MLEVSDIIHNFHISSIIIGIISDRHIYLKLHLLSNSQKGIDSA